MKIRTNLKSGNVINDATNFVKTGVSSVTDFVVAANKQAKSVTDTVTGATSKTWNWLTGWL